MRKIIFLLLFALSSAMSAAPLAIRIDVRARSGTLSPASSGLQFAKWLKEKQETRLIYSMKTEKAEWTSCSFSFIPTESGNVTLTLRGPDQGKRPPQWVLYRNIRRNGKLLPNGNFSKEFSNWHRRKTDTGSQAQLVEDPALTPQGRCVRVWHDGYLAQAVPVKAGEKVTLTVDACPTLAFTSVTGAWPLSLRHVANRDYADEVEGDGKGGWSDQGPEMDMRKLDITRKQFAGVSFDLIDPRENQGKAVVVFDSSRAPTGLKEIVLDLPEAAKNTRFLYLLHTACWVPATPTPVGTIIFEDGSGKLTTQEIVSGTDVRDWVHPSSAPNAEIASCSPWLGHKRTLFLSKYPLPLRGAQKIRLRTTGKTVWILCGATLTAKDVIWNNAPFIPQAPEYKTADLSPRPLIQPGSALDFSTLVDHTAAGTFGRAILAGNGMMEFPKRPGIPLRFRAAYHFASEWSFLSLIRKKTAEELKSLIDIYVGELRRRGYNMVRTHTVEQFLMLDAPEKGRPDPRFADALDYCFAKLKENGIYLNLNIAAYQLTYPFKISSTSRPDDIKPRMLFGDRQIRQDWLDTASYLLCHKNAYTGTALKDDPMLVCVEPFNELTMGIRQHPYRNAATRKLVRDKFRAFVLQRNGKVDEAEFPENPNEVNGGKLHVEWIEFCAESMRETGAWMNARLRELGCKVPIGQYNLRGERFHGGIRSEQSDVVIRNKYFCHPNNLSRPGSITRQESAIETGVPYFTEIASCRLTDRPLIVTEYNHARNLYEYEQLLFPAYAALQGFTGITMHAVDMRQRQEGDKEFSTYLDRMTENLSFFLFQQGYVSPSFNLVELIIPKESLNKNDADSNINTAQAQWAFFSRFGVRYDKTARPAMLSTLPVPKPVLSIPLFGYAPFGTEFVETGSTKGKKFNSAPLIASLKVQEIIPLGNRTDPKKGIWESDTGELLLNIPEKFFRIRTPRVEAVAFEKNSGESLPVLAQTFSSVPSTVALVSLDGKELAKDSKRMLLFYLTDNVNTGMELSPDRSILRRPGKAPTLLRTGQLELQLNLPAGKRYLLYPLRSDGLRREGIPLTKNGSGYRLELNTAALPHGPTGVFELVTEP